MYNLQELQARLFTIRHSSIDVDSEIFCLAGDPDSFLDVCSKSNSEFIHCPNVSVDTNGDVCISILHEPGDDNFGYERASERWLPIHTVETILISVISMLADPNDESPANVDAAKEWRKEPDVFKKRVVRCVRKSQEEL